jgi:hypothetical protein
MAKAIAGYSNYLNSALKRGASEMGKTNKMENKIKENLAFNALLITN